MQLECTTFNVRRPPFRAIDNPKFCLREFIADVAQRNRLWAERNAQQLKGSVRHIERAANKPVDLIYICMLSVFKNLSLPYLYMGRKLPVSN